MELSLIHICINFQSNEDIRERLKPDTEIGTGEWVDISGLIAPKSEIEKLMCGIESGEINRLKEINACFSEMHNNYYTYEWTWAYGKIQEFYGLDPETIKMCIRESPSRWTRKAQMENVRLFVSGSNLLTWTSYKNVDPEQPINGIPTFALPTLKSVTFGIEIGL